MLMKIVTGCDAATQRRGAQNIHTIRPSFFFTDFHVTLKVQLLEPIL